MLSTTVNMVARFCHICSFEKAAPVTLLYMNHLQRASVLDILHWQTTLPMQFGEVATRGRKGKSSPPSSPPSSLPPSPSLRPPSFAPLVFTPSRSVGRFGNEQWECAVQQVSCALISLTACPGTIGSFLNCIPAEFLCSRKTFSLPVLLPVSVLRLAFARTGSPCSVLFLCSANFLLHLLFLTLLFPYNRPLPAPASRRPTFPAPRGAGPLRGASTRGRAAESGIGRGAPRGRGRGRGGRRAATKEEEVVGLCFSLGYFYNTKYMWRPVTYGLNNIDRNILPPPAFSTLCGSASSPASVAPPTFDFPSSPVSFQLSADSVPSHTPFSPHSALCSPGTPVLGAPLLCNLRARVVDVQSARRYEFRLNEIAAQDVSRAQLRGASKFVLRYPPATADLLCRLESLNVLTRARNRMTELLAANPEDMRTPISTPKQESPDLLAAWADVYDLLLNATTRAAKSVQEFDYSMPRHLPQPSGAGPAGGAGPSATDGEEDEEVVG